MLSVEISIYLLEDPDYRSKLKELLAELDDVQIRAEVGAMSTLITGEDEAVWRALRRLFERADQNGWQIVMHANFSNCCICQL